MNLYPFKPAHESPVIPLKDLLPLKVPLAILIDPVNVCNFRCTFCPTGNHDLLEEVGRPKGSMSLEFFRKILDDLKAMTEEHGQKVKRLHLYKDGEPLINKDLGAMIAYAKEKQVALNVETTSNASLITEARAIELIEAGLDQIRISIEHVRASGYKAITQTYDNFEKVKQNVAFLFQEKTRRQSPLKVYVKIVDTGLSEEDKTFFYDTFSPISDSIHIDQLMGWSKSSEKDWKLGKDVNLGMNGITPRKEKVVCPEVFSKLAVNFDGTVSLCCVDWSHGTVVGDLKTQSLSEVWHGEPLQRMRLLHLTGRRNEISPCANCDYVYGLPDYTFLDDDAQRLIPVYSKRSPCCNP